jgi:hypothetical protein
MHLELPVQRRQTVLEAEQPGAAVQHGSAPAVVTHLDL